MGILWLIAAIILVLWLGGLIAGAGNLIHILLVIALILLIYNLITGRRVA